MNTLQVFLKSLSEDSLQTVITTLEDAHEHSVAYFEEELVHEPNPHGQDREYYREVPVCECGAVQDYAGVWNE